jgi:hypothetical protein
MAFAMAKKEGASTVMGLCYGAITKLMNFTARGRNGWTGHEEITGETPDISKYVDFDFYDWVW